MEYVYDMFMLTLKIVPAVQFLLCKSLQAKKTKKND